MIVVTEGYFEVLDTSVKSDGIRADQKCRLKCIEFLTFHHTLIGRTECFGLIVFMVFMAQIPRNGVYLPRALKS